MPIQFSSSHYFSRPSLVTLCRIVFATLLGSVFLELPMRASPSSNFDWGLNLPDNPVPRRVAKNLKFQGPNPFVLAEINGPGCIRRFWVTGNNIGRDVILRI